MKKGLTMEKDNESYHHILQKAFVDYFLIIQNQEYGEAYHVECTAILEELVKKYAEVENTRLNGLSGSL